MCIKIQKLMTGSLLCMLVLTGCALRGSRPDPQITYADGNFDTGYPAGTAATKAEIAVISEKSSISLEESIQACHCMVTARLTGIEYKGTHRLLSFTLERHILGVECEKEFTVTDAPLDDIVYTDAEVSANWAPYEVGKDYILILYKMSSVYFDSPEYQAVGFGFIALDEAGGIAEYRYDGEKKEPEFHTVDEFIAYVSLVTDLEAPRDSFGNPFTDSADMGEIVEVSEYIVVITVKQEHFSNAEGNRAIHTCEVVERLRGSVEDEIEVILFKDTVTIGRRYLVLLNKGDMSRSYTLSSRSSVIPLEDTERVTEVEALVSKVKAGQGRSDGT